MYPSYYCSQVMTDALLLDHQQMVQREIERNRWARLAGSRTSLAARVAHHAVTMARACAAWLGRATGERVRRQTSGAAPIPRQRGAHIEPEERCSA